MIKSREMRCDMYGDIRNAYIVLVRKIEGRRPLLQDLDLDMRTALKLITNKLDVMAWTGFIRINIERIGGLLRRWQENSGSIKCVDCMHWMGNYLLATQEGICSVKSVTLSHSLVHSPKRLKSLQIRFHSIWSKKDLSITWDFRLDGLPPQQHVIFHHL